MESIYLESLLRPAENFNERLDSIVSWEDPIASRNATERLYAEPFANNCKPFILFSVRGLLVWLCSSSMLPRRQTQASVSLRESGRLVEFIYCTRASSSAQPDSGGNIRNKSSNFLTQNVLGNRE